MNDIMQLTVLLHKFGIEYNTNLNKEDKAYPYWEISFNSGDYSVVTFGFNKEQKFIKLEINE